MCQKDKSLPLVGFDPKEPGDPSEMRRWRAARDRVLGYLDALETPAPRSLEICLKVLQTAREQGCRGDAPVTAAMTHLYKMPADEIRVPVQNGRPEGTDPLIPSIPELNRGKMVPEELGFAPVRHIRKRRRRPPDRKRRGSDLLLGLVLAFSSLIL